MVCVGVLFTVIPCTATWWELPGAGSSAGHHFSRLRPGAGADGAAQASAADSQFFGSSSAGSSCLFKVTLQQTA